MIQTEKASERLVDQRVRNRIMEELLDLSQGERCLDDSGAVEWFESFFDHFPYAGSTAPNFLLSTFTEDELAALSPVVAAMQAALVDTPRFVTNAQLLASGWPRRIAPLAEAALATFLTRGRFSEEVEEEAPSSPVPWP